MRKSVLGTIEKFQMRREVETQRVALETSEREYRTLMEALPQPVCLTGSSGDMRFGKRRWLEHTGLVPADSPRLNDVILPEDRCRFETQWDEALPVDRDFKMELRLRRVSDGANRQHPIRCIPIHGGPCGTT